MLSAHMEIKAGTYTGNFRRYLMEMTGMKIFMAICMMPVLPMMFGACWFLAEEKNRTHAGCFFIERN